MTCCFEIIMVRVVTQCFKFRHLLPLWIWHLDGPGDNAPEMCKDIQETMADNHAKFHADQ